MKKTIVHIIDDLGRGGAETMLVTIAKNLSAYHNIIVTLYPRNEFSKAEMNGIEMYCLHLQSRLHIPLAAAQLKKLLIDKKVDLVHSHLFWATVVARFGVPTKIPLLTTIHAFVKSSVEYKPWRMRLIEKWTYNYRKSTIIAVAKGALEEYFSFIGIKPHNAVAVYTFVDTSIFNDAAAMPILKKDEGFSLITVGNLKGQKNHQFLLEAFKKLKNENIRLDIYGNGILEESLQKIIDEQQLPVTLKGQVGNIQQVINQYNLFVMSSTYEGFALSVLEAMALGMPLLLSDINSFREQCGDTAVYFDVNNPDDFVAKLIALKNNTTLLKELGNAAKEKALNNYTLEHHLIELNKIYSDTLNEVLV
jgi:L-malate glycosyltransferase